MSSPSSGGYRGRPGHWGRGRGTTRGSSSYRGTSRPNTDSISLPSDKNIKESLTTTPLETLNIPYLTGTKTVRADVQNVEYIGSYNWIEAKEPTIIVPGSPPEWTDPRPPIVLSPDSGTSFSDQNGFRLPSSPLLPLFSAVDSVASTTIDWPSIDFVTDRNGLRKLLRWIDGSATKDFRMDLEMAGTKTVLVNRWDKRQREAANGKSFGFEFEKATTRAAKGCERSTGHHRIIKYDFCGMNMVVRFEVDACLPILRAKTPAKQAVTAPSRSSSAQSPDDLADALAGLNIISSLPDVDDTTSSPDVKPQSSSIKIIHGGTEVPQESIMELATRSQYFVHEINWGEIFPQLFLSNTPIFYLGVHNRGRFDEIRKMKLSGDELGSQREEAEVNFRKLGKALRTIQEVVKKYGKGRRVSLVCESGTLRVYERVGRQSCLPSGPEGVGRFE